MMTINKPDRNTAEKYLLAVLTSVGRTGVRTLSELQAVPEMESMFFEALRWWLILVGLNQNTCATISRYLRTTPEDLADDYLVRLMNNNRRVRGKDGMTEEEYAEAASRPAMDKVLALACDSSPRSVVTYLMCGCVNFCRDMYRKESRAIRSTADSTPEELRQTPAESAGTAISAPVKGTDEAVLRHDRMVSMFRCFGSERAFLHNLALLSDAVKIPRKVLAKAIIAGRFTAVINVIVERMNQLLDGDYAEGFEALYAIARTYRLNERLQDEKTLLSHLYRGTTTAKRDKLWNTVSAAIAC
ncbi:MAG: hypothetical protein IJ343_08105 [Clostridia bacterium]|nr:hypothetical protein [Clostridia bacterium]